MPISNNVMKTDLGIPFLSSSADYVHTHLPVRMKCFSAVWWTQTWRQGLDTPPPLLCGPDTVHALLVLQIASSQNDQAAHRPTPWIPSVGEVVYWRVACMVLRKLYPRFPSWVLSSLCPYNTERERRPSIFDKYLFRTCITSLCITIIWDRVYL